MSRFQVAQFAHEGVVIPVGNRGIIEYGVSVVVLVELFNELCNVVDGFHQKGTRALRVGQVRSDRFSRSFLQRAGLSNLMLRLV